MMSTKKYRIRLHYSRYEHSLNSGRLGLTRVGLRRMNPMTKCARF